MKVDIRAWPKKGERKIHVKIESFDVWNLDQTFALIAYPALQQLKKSKQGIPSSFSAVGGEDYTGQQCFDFYAATNEWFELRVEQWNAVLDKMIWAFHEIAFEPGENKYYPEGGEYDHIGLMKYNDRLQEGLDLFAKHYMSLWT